MKEREYELEIERSSRELVWEVEREESETDKRNDMSFSFL